MDTLLSLIFRATEIPLKSVYPSATSKNFNKVALGPYEISAKFRVARKKIGQKLDRTSQRCRNFYLSRGFAGGATLTFVPKR